MQLVIDHNLITYQTTGQGSRVVLLLHGWTGAAHQSFVGLAAQLSRNYRVVMPDLPGFGESPPPPDNWGVPQYGQFLETFIDKLGVKPEAVIGHSNGGTLAIYAISQKLVNPSKLVLLASAGIRGTDQAKKTALKLAAKPVKLLLMPLPKASQERIKRRVYGRLGSDLYVLPAMQPIFKRVVGYDAREDARAVTVPTLLVYGADDTSTPPRFGQIFRGSMPNARWQSTRLVRSL